MDFAELYAGRDFGDDMIGMSLDHGMAVIARKNEI